MNDPTPSEAVRPQHLEALQRANVIRVGIADTKRKIALGALSLDAVIAGDVPEVVEYVDRMPVGDLLVAGHRVGNTIARKVLAAAGNVPQEKRVGRLTPRQRQAIIAGVRARAPWTCHAEEVVA